MLVEAFIYHRKRLRMTRSALLSVSNKQGLLELATTLVREFNFRLISSGGTAQTLKEAGLPVIKVSDYTGSPEILGGRVKTLHPRIHGGILARRDLPQDCADLEAQQIPLIDLVVVNLYPFQQTVARPEVTLAEAIDQIDIGGPTLLRASAKNHAHVTVLCDPDQYDVYLEELRQHQGETSLAFRQVCALRAFQHTADYDRAISDYLYRYLSLSSTQPLPHQADRATNPTEDTQTGHATVFTLTGQLKQVLRYGENPHQPASWYQSGNTGWTTAHQIQGKELSYNNLLDLEAARQVIAEFAQPDCLAAAVIIKHTNPCGVALGDTLVEAYTKAFNADDVSAFGGIVALNRPIDAPTAEALTQTFLECVVAPGCEPEAQALLSKKSKLRVLVLPEIQGIAQPVVKTIAGGFLVQASDDQPDDPNQWQVVTTRQPTPDQWQDLQFAWTVAKHVKSNAIVVSRDRVTLGIGAGQMNRVGSVAIALNQAGNQATGAVLASDGFFPFDDSVRTAAAAGIYAIIQPGGSLRDQDSITAANELGLVMVFTGCRHFLH